LGYKENLFQNTEKTEDNLFNQHIENLSQSMPINALALFPPSKPLFNETIAEPTSHNSGPVNVILGSNENLFQDTKKTEDDLFNQYLKNVPQSMPIYSLSLLPSSKPLFNKTLADPAFHKPESTKQKVKENSFDDKKKNKKDRKDIVKINFTEEPPDFGDARAVARSPRLEQKLSHKKKVTSIDPKDIYYTPHQIILKQCILLLS